VKIIELYFSKNFMASAVASLIIWTSSTIAFLMHILIYWSWKTPSWNHFPSEFCIIRFLLFTYALAGDFSIRPRLTVVSGRAELHKDQAESLGNRSAASFDYRRNNLEIPSTLGGVLGCTQQGRLVSDAENDATHGNRCLNFSRWNFDSAVNSV
jgi:hypothetical protein